MARWLIALVVLGGALLGCANFDATRGQHHLKERFLQLAFWEVDHGFPYGKSYQPRMLYKKKHIISFTGSAAKTYEKEIAEVIGFYRRHFDIEYGFGFNEYANIHFNLFDLDIPKEGAAGRHILTAAKNADNTTLHRLTGWSPVLDKAQNYADLTNELNLYKSDYWESGAINPCRIRYFWRDKTITEQAYGIGGARLPQGWRERPDYIIGNVFTLFKGDDLDAFYAHNKTSVAEQKSAILLCLYEEIGHAVSYWGDVPSEDHVPFSSDLHKKRRTPPDQKRFDEGDDGYLSNYLSHLDHLDEMLGYFETYNLKGGMAYDEVRAALYGVP